MEDTSWSDLLNLDDCRNLPVDSKKCLSLPLADPAPHGGTKMHKSATKLIRKFVKLTVHTGWTGKYVPPGSPQVAPIGATWGLPIKQFHHMLITNPEFTNFQKSEFQVWGLPGGYLLSNLFPPNFKDGGYLLSHSFIQWFNDGGYLWHTWGLPSNLLTSVRFQGWGLPLTHLGGYLVICLFQPDFKCGGYL